MVWNYQYSYIYFLLILLVTVFLGPLEVYNLLQTERALCVAILACPALNKYPYKGARARHLYTSLFLNNHLAAVGCMKACENLFEEGLDVQIPETWPWCKQKMTIEAFSRCSHNFDEHREKFASLVQTGSICINALHVTFGCGDGSDRAPVLEYDCVFAFGSKSWSFHSKFEMYFSMNQWEISVDATERHHSSPSS